MTAANQCDAERSVQASIRPARSVATATLLSRILGLVRDKVTVFAFSSSVADALFLAWTIPNLTRRLFGEGALGAALVPVLAKAEQHGGALQRDRAACSVITALAAFLVPITALSMVILLALPERWWTGVFDSAEVGRETRHLLSIMLPYLVLVCVAAQMQALANLAGRFFVPAISPALLNLLWIVAALCALQWGGDARVEWVAYGILLGGVMQIAVQWWELRRAGVAISWAPVATPEVKDVVARAAPMVLGLAASQINLLIDRMLAESLVPGDGAIRQLYLGNRLMQLPLGLIGAAIGTAVYPTLARAAASGDHRALGEALATALRVSLGLALPAMFGLAVLAGPIMALLFEGGQFSMQDASISAACLVAYAPTMLFQSAVLLQARVDYAQGRQRRVVRVGLIAVAVNLLLDFALVFPFGAMGLALATTLASLVNAVLLALGLGVWTHLSFRRQLLTPLLRVAGCALSMALGVVGVRLLLQLLELPRWLDIGGVSIPLRAACLVAAGIPTGILGFFFVGKLLAPQQIQEISTLIRRRRSSRQS